MRQIADNPYLCLPLDGVRLIEASAGTGKTFTLATLFIRLVVEKRLKVGEILTLTYTEAATQELRRRIRERLLLAARLVNNALSEDASHEERLTFVILSRHLDKNEESARALARRLQVAAEEIDLAAIFTIHGFCMRVLSEHTLDSEHGFIQAELLPDPRMLEDGIAHDLWRQYANTGNTLDPLTWLWQSPQQLGIAIADLISPLPLFPARPDAFHENNLTAHLQERAQTLAAAVRCHGDDYAARILAAIDAGVLNKTSYKKNIMETLLERLCGWAKTPDTDFRLLAPDGLEKITLDALTKGTKKAGIGKTPVSSLQPIIADYLDVHSNWRRWQYLRSVDLLHHLRDVARERIAAFKYQHRVYTYDDLIERVASALQGEHGQTLVTGLRKQYKIALVDEFQDTDAHQWSIFQRVFSRSHEPSLFLIGDPKQAIYGFRGGDVQTYLRAKAESDVAPSLDCNFRSRPCVLRAIEVLYGNVGENAFADPQIRFVPVAAGNVCQDNDYLVHGQTAPALTLRMFRSGNGKPLKTDDSRAVATSACVADIFKVLSAAREGHALINGKPVEPADIAVLVRSHKEADRVRRELAAAGIPAVAAGKSSLFATDEAREIHVLLSACVQASDMRFLRAALASVLIGLDAGAIAALEAEALQRWQQRVLSWRERWRRGGIISLVNDLCSEHAQRLLQLTDGERRLTNYLHLAEHLQIASNDVPGMHGLLDWLEQRIANANPDDETQLLRLESDARRVQIITLHKSKGLEYPLVYLPFVAIGKEREDFSDHQVIYNNQQREIHWKIDKDSEDWKRVKEQAKLDNRAEDARLFYVGLTRAVHALWIAAGDFAASANTPLAPMLDGHLDVLAAHPDVAVIDIAPEPAPQPLLAAKKIPPPPEPRISKRQIFSDWWIHSFTQLVRDDISEANVGSQDESAAEDEVAISAPLPEMLTADLRFSGSRFGNVLHAALEKTDFSAWASWRQGMSVPEGQEKILRDVLRKYDYHDDDESDGLVLLTQLVGMSLTVDLPESGALYCLPKECRCVELEFHFLLPSTNVSQVIALLHAHGVIRERSGFGNRQRLYGLMTGKIDLTYVRDGRWYVLDYKSNRLPQYDQPALERTMRYSEYDLQALIYTLALHRWLRFRLRDEYDYSRDFGGIRYLFCRGLCVRADGGVDGIHARRFAPELVMALDELFTGREQEGV